jgi:hypothetical protein
MQSTGQTSTQAESLVPTHGSQMIYATTFPRINSLQPKSIARSLAPAAIAAAVWLTSAWPIDAQRRGASLPPTDWRPAPEYVALFAPAARADAYRAYVTKLTTGELLRSIENRAALGHPPRVWEARLESPLDAFGRSGPYDRLKLARLYGSRRVTVTRGPLTVDGRVVESWTIISPFPDPRLQRLETGTLILVLTLP